MDSTHLTSTERRGFFEVLPKRALLPLRTIKWELIKRILKTYAQVREHTHKYTDHALFRYQCPSGWTEDRKEPWKQDEAYDDVHCQKTSDTTSSGGGETRPKNIRVVYIIKIYWIPTKPVRCYRIQIVFSSMKFKAIINEHKQYVLHWMRFFWPIRFEWLDNDWIKYKCCSNVEIVFL